MGLIPHGDEHDRGNRDRGAEPGEGLKQGPEAERDDDGLDALVGRLGTDRRRTSRSYPVSSVVRKIQFAVNTVHLIGKNPNAAPSLAASRACPAGIPNAKVVTDIATTREATPACHGFQRRPRAAPKCQQRRNRNKRGQRQ